MDILINRGAVDAVAAATSTGDVSYSALPATDVSGIRSAALNAATSSSTHESGPSTSLSARTDQIKIVILPGNPNDPHIQFMRGGHRVPFTGREHKEVSAIIDTLRQLTGDTHLGHVAIERGNHFNPQPVQTQHAHHHAAPHLSISADLRPGSLEPQPLSARDSQSPRPESERPTEKSDPTKPDHIREKIERVLERVTDHARERLVTLSSDLGTASQERTVQTIKQDARPADIRPTGDVSQTPFFQRTQENLLGAKESAPMSNVAINAILNDSRNDYAQRMQQVLNGQFPMQAQTTASTSVDRPASTSQPTEVYESVQEKFAQIREALQTAIARSHPERLTAPSYNPETSLTSGDFTKFAVPLRDVRPISTIAAQGRAASDRGSADAPPKPPSISRIDSEGRITPSFSTQASGPTQLLRAVGALSSSTVFSPLEKGTSLIDALSRRSQRVVNLSVLHKVNHALETVVISGAAAVVLGVMSGEALLKQVIRLGRTVLSRLRDSGPLSNEDEAEHIAIEEMINDLEKVCSEPDIDNADKSVGIVSDITGEIILSDTGLPVEGIVVDAGPLGTVITDTFGAFMFKNVQLETGFSLTCHDKRYSFTPNPIVSTVSTRNHFTIQAIATR